MTVLYRAVFLAPGITATLFAVRPSASYPFSHGKQMLKWLARTILLVMAACFIALAFLH